MNDALSIHLRWWTVLITWRGCISESPAPAGPVSVHDAGPSRFVPDNCLEICFLTAVVTVCRYGRQRAAIAVQRSRDFREWHLQRFHRSGTYSAHRQACPLLIRRASVTRRHHDVGVGIDGDRVRAAGFEGDRGQVDADLRGRRGAPTDTN